MNAVVSHQIWNYIGMLGLDRETALDLYQEAETAIWEVSVFRAYNDNHSYLVKTGIGVMRHWLRDRYNLIRIPGYLHDRKEASQHMKTIIPLEEARETTGYQFEDDCLDRLEDEAKHQQILALLPHLTKAERQVMIGLLNGLDYQTIANIKKVRISSVSNLKAKAIIKLQRLLVEQSQPVVLAA